MLPILTKVLKLIDSYKTSSTNWDVWESFRLLAILALKNIDALGQAAASLTLVYQSAMSEWITLSESVLREYDGGASFWFLDKLVMRILN